MNKSEAEIIELRLELVWKGSGRRMWSLSSSQRTGNLSELTKQIRVWIKMVYITKNQPIKLGYYAKLRKTLFTGNPN